MAHTWQAVVLQPRPGALLDRSAVPSPEVARRLLQGREVARLEEVDIPLRGGGTLAFQCTCIPQAAARPAGIAAGRVVEATTVYFDLGCKVALATEGGVDPGEASDVPEYQAAARSMLSHLATHASTRTVSVLVTGPRGYGKSHLLARTARLLNANSITVTAADLTALSPGDPGRALQQWMGLAASLAPCMMVVDRIEEVFHGERGGTSTEALLASQFRRGVGAGKPGTGVIYAGTYDGEGEVSEYVRSSFDYEVQLEAYISPPTRRALLTSALARVRAPFRVDAQVDEVMSHCYSLAPTDMAALCGMAAMLSSSAGRIITSAHFSAAAARLKPVALLDVAALEVPRVAMADIGGLEEVKARLEEAVVWPIIHSQAFEAMGVRPPVGVLLYGPPGTGKTMLAKAVANSTTFNFVSVSISDLMRGEVGESERMIRTVFARARQAAPCVVFFDEMQAVFGRRDNAGSVGQKMITQLMMEMDSIAHSHHRIVVLGATNVPDGLDPSFFRPGRFDTVVSVGLPDHAARVHMLEKICRTMRVSKGLPLGSLAMVMEGFSGAEVMNTCRKAGMNALIRADDEANATITVEDFQGAIGAVQAMRAGAFKG